MSVIIAGTNVQIGDRLFSRRAATTGIVVSVGVTTATAEFVIGAETRRYVITNGGFVSGVRDVYWHEPLELDLPKAQIGKVDKIQNVVDALIAVL